VPKGNTHTPGLIGISAAVVLATTLAFASLPQAFAEFSAPSDSARVLGVGRIQAHAPAAAVSSTLSRFSPDVVAGVEPEKMEQLATPLVREPAPSLTEASAPTSPDPSAESPRITPELVVTEPGKPAESTTGAWQACRATAYGPTNAGRWTASGTELTHDSCGVAIDRSMAHLLGRTIEIDYNGTVMTAVVNDTSNSLAYGRLLDLQPGLWHALGFSDEYQWGVRTVQWRLVG
jgi:hypothetical protein